METSRTGLVKRGHSCLKKSNKQQIARLAQLLGRRKLSFILSFLGFGLMSSSVSIITAMLVSTFLDAITEKNMAAVMTLSIQFMLIVIAMCILTPLFQYWYGKTVKTIMNSMRLRVFHHMEKLPVTYYENSHSGDSLSRITNDLQTMENAFSGEALTLLSLMATGTISAVIMFYLDWRFAVAMIFLGMLSTYVNSRYAKPFRTIGTEIQEQSGVQLERLTNLVAGTQVSRTFQMVDGMNRKYKETTTRLANLFLLRAKKAPI